MSRIAKGALSQPLVGPDVAEDCDKDGTPNDTDMDDDNDVLPDFLEEHAKTNPCAPDSDGDQLLDGWEYLSAIDLNKNNLPYPGKKPYPNALYADAEIDYDGDGLYAWAEHTMWLWGGHTYPLDYSDGNQTTVPEPVNGNVWNDLQYRWDELSDDERDFDKDGLANIYEFRHASFEPWGFPSVIRPDFMDPDTDGDGVLDGYDDQDHDDFSNIQELRAGTWTMNPCDPDPVSRTCPRWLAPTEQPKKPTLTCYSRTLETRGEEAIPYFKDFKLSMVDSPGSPGWCRKWPETP
jgi:hypothetical protein